MNNENIKMDCSENSDNLKTRRSQWYSGGTSRPLLRSIIKNEFALTNYSTQPTRHFNCAADGECSFRYINTDTKENYKENLKKESNEWYYRNHNFDYTVNKFGYRTKPFDQINWEKSIVIFGCSTIFGVGVNNEHSVPYFLEQISGIPVVNMGIPGASNQFIAHNNVILSDSKYPTPKAVINSWTGLSRYALYNTVSVDHRGWWKHDDLVTSEFARSSNILPFNLMNIKICRNIWKNKTIYKEFCAWDPIENIIERIDENFELIRVYTQLDWEHLRNDVTKSYMGRDILHNGHTTNKAIAEILFENIKNEL